MNIRTINDRWKEFESACIAQEACAMQRQEMKRAFFAGYTSAMACFLTEIPEMTEDEGGQAIESQVKQVQGFNEAIKLGGA